MRTQAEELTIRGVCYTGTPTMTSNQEIRVVRNGIGDVTLYFPAFESTPNIGLTPGGSGGAYIVKMSSVTGPSPSSARISVQTSGGAATDAEFMFSITGRRKR